MREPMMLKIGDFARVAHVSIATLRHYEKLGLLKPYALDTETGYRSYCLDQLPRLHRILALKDLGFPLGQIRQLLQEDLSLDQLRGMLTLQQRQTQQLIEMEQARLSRIVTRLRHIEQEGNMPAHEVLLKQVEPLLVASVRTLIPLGEDLGWPSTTMMSYLDQQGIQHAHPAILLLHSRYQWHDDVMAIDVESAVPVLTTPSSNQHMSTRTLPGSLMACSVYAGGDLSAGHVYAALNHWVKDNRYQVIGPPRLLHLQRAEHMDPRHSVTEVQLPVTFQTG